MTQPLAAGDSVGRYTVIRPLGQGGMGLVFEVKHQTLGTRAALKAAVDRPNDQPRASRPLPNRSPRGGSSSIPASCAS